MRKKGVAVMMTINAFLYLFYSLSSTLSFFIPPHANTRKKHFRMHDLWWQKKNSVRFSPFLGIYMHVYTSQKLYVYAHLSVLWRCARTLIHFDFVIRSKRAHTHTLNNTPSSSFLSLFAHDSACKHGTQENW
uniref:Uncharacterized protein n=1 Tax=Trypanosoma congolense (strain IL3000) TaxID=1068625 RepID=G0V2I5_TRYCI|nr:hypothetical protein, unlikely [Trypanosoma congolense IL3000]